MGHVRGSNIYPPQVVSCHHYILLQRYSLIIDNCQNIAMVLWVTVAPEIAAGWYFSAGYI